MGAIRALDDDICLAEAGLHVSLADGRLLEEVAAFVNRGGAWRQRLFYRQDGGQGFVLHDDLCDGLVR